MSATQFPMATLAPISENSPSWPASSDGWTEDSDTSLLSPPCSPPSGGATATANRKRKTSKIKQGVPKQHEPTAFEQDARTIAATLVKRVERAAKRAVKQYAAVVHLEESLRRVTAHHTRAVSAASDCKQAATAASANLTQARANARAAKKSCEKSYEHSRPRRVLRYVMAAWGAEPRLDVEEAARLVEEADREERLARAQEAAAGEVKDAALSEKETTMYLLREAEEGEVRALKILSALEAKAARAEDRAVQAASTVELGRCWERNVYADGGGDRMDPLLIAAALLAATVEDDDSDDDEEGATMTKRARH